MSRCGKEYLIELINAVVYAPNIFRIKISDSDKYIFAIITPDVKTTQWYDVSAIYDSVCEIDRQIKYAFSYVIKYDLPTTLSGYDPFREISEEEYELIYHIENIVFRVSILWDLLAQLCNVIYETGYEKNKVFYNRYFEKYSSGDNEIEIVKRIKSYIDEEDTSEDINHWPGNHAFLNEYRNQIAHRASPNITSVSTFGAIVRPPSMYVLHRAIEDYYMVSSFLYETINKFIDERKDWMPIGLPKIE